MIGTLAIVAASFGFVGLLIYLVLRYGPVSHSWVKLKKEQIKSLKAANKRYSSTRPKTKPMGKPLYKRKMISHDGLAIFNNGIYAKFCIGNKGRYRFVPFEEISGIYPVKIENPFAKRDSMWFGLTSWKALQVETKSSMVCLIDARKHDFRKVIPILKKAMGSRWNGLYHPDEVLWSNILEGDALVHKSIRSEKPPSVVQERPFVEPTVLPPSEGKGSLLLEESLEDVRERGKSWRKGSALLCSIALCLIAVGTILLLYLPHFLLFFLGFLFIFSGVIFLLLGLVILVASYRIRPLRIYEHGFEAPTLLGDRKLFISFGEVTSMRERSTLIEGEVYFFDTGKPTQSVYLRKCTKGLDRYIDLIKSRIGRGEYLIELQPTEEEVAASRKLEYTLYLSGMLVGVVASVILIIYVFAGKSPFYYLYGLGLVLPALTMITTTYMTFRMRKMEKLAPRKLNVKVPAAIVVGLLTYFLINLAVGYLVSGGPSMPEVNLEPKPTSSYLAPGSYDSVNLSIEGSILVDSGETLHLRNSTLLMNLSSDGQFGIWVAEGGTLVLENSRIESLDPELSYTFEIMGSSTISGCYISGVWGDPDHENFDGGLEIYSSDVTIENTTIRDARTNGLLITNSDPTIANSTIENALDDGIEMHNSNALIANNSIKGCGWAIVVSHRSKPLIKGNRISGNDHGICVQESSPVIEDNHFSLNGHYAINYDEFSSPSIRGNSFNSNEANVVEEELTWAMKVCSISTVAVAIICLLVLFWVYKEGLRKEQ